MTTTAARKPRVADATQPAKPKRVRKPAASADPICAELDRLDEDDEVFYLGNGHPPAMQAIRNLDEAQRLRTHEMLDSQRTYLQVMEDLVDPCDQSGRTHDLRAMGSSVMAIAWTLSLLGYRKVAAPRIRRRPVKGAFYADACTWVDVRAPLTAEEELSAKHRGDDTSLPPDIRALASQRDGLPGMPVTSEWSVSVKPKIIEAPRPKDW